MSNSDFRDKIERIFNGWLDRHEHGDPILHTPAREFAADAVRDCRDLVLKVMFLNPLIDEAMSDVRKFASNITDKPIPVLAAKPSTIERVLDARDVGRTGGSIPSTGANAETRPSESAGSSPPAVFADPENGDCVTCYEQDEEKCFDGMCLRTGCRKRNERIASPTAVRDEVNEITAVNVIEILESEIGIKIKPIGNIRNDWTFETEILGMASAARRIALLTTRADVE